ncbi:DEAD/DEAH box helicase [Aeromicrobium duanguangcaii]|uniref:DEAD/DEAH box helicase n=1 Tax=Aeromicrobium duanguangcaii TaxID=2968086 RepID=A0ABY5KHT4_9ACTN|nr:DEAD/DEAH box helicase [Aeromicrobium duanguangcaii]MCD9154207.1 DEAD/DEAH box helicase [Aeromicrobium duanguangcaii]UUI68722.1 DEAD/DEAH box helicase [Aeromicrobium duanguangcaii]
MQLHPALARHGERLVHVQHHPAVEPVVEPWPAWIDPEVRELFAAEGADVLWGHQAEALAALHDRRNVVVATGTASGKSLVYQAAALQALREGRGGSSLSGARRPSVLYLAPTKALAADQLRRLPVATGLRPATVDGDNSREQRAWARDHANWVLANPDILHRTILPTHERWARLLAGLRVVVIDECHHYRGVFGAHVALILRRLRRICQHYGADPLFVLSSATVAEPAASAERLLGAPVTAVTEDASPHAARTVAFWQPPLRASREGVEFRRAAGSEAADLLTDLVVDGTRTLVFVRSRRGAEQLAMTTRRALAEVHPELADRVATYRGGYLPEERRELESRLRSGDLLGLASTNALELGIDIAGLDAVVSVGFPGTRAALWQQWGRAGRAGVDSIGVMIARDDPLDSFLVHHPEAVLGAPVEATVFDPENPYVLGPHLAAAAQELPLTEADFDRFGPRAGEGVAALEAAGMLRRRASGWFWTSRERAADLADIRSAGGHPVQIVEGSTGRLVGTVDAGSADAEVHEGAIYVHRGEDHLVEAYDPEQGTAVVRRAEVHHTTSARTATAVTIVEQRRETQWGPATIAFGDVEVASQVVGYQIRDRSTGRIIGEEPLALPERTLPTAAVWWTLDTDVALSLMDPEALPGAAHAAEHAAIGILPLLATCDRWDIGGLSTAHHPDTGRLTVFVHDGHRGGAGFAERGYEQMAAWLRMTRQTIDDCACRDGCPSCVVSPKCGNGNHPLDKAGAVVLLDAVLASCVD